MIHPKLFDGLETQNWISAINPLPLQVWFVFSAPTGVLALMVGEKSPPGVVQKFVL